MLPVGYADRFSRSIARNMSFSSCEWTDSTASAAVNIFPEVESMKNEIFENRRWFHQYPELSFEEKGTSKKVVAMIRGGSDGPCVALRADMV
jgi:hypothetical protein